MTTCNKYIDRPYARILLGLVSMLVFLALPSTLAHRVACPVLSLQRQFLGGAGERVWHTSTEVVSWNPKRTALFIIDVRDKHWCYAEDFKLNSLAPAINTFTEAARTAGITIMHGPSECMPFYRSHPARKRATSVEQRETPTRDFVPLPDFPYALHTTHQCSTNVRPRQSRYATPWTRQHPIIFIDRDEDAIVDPTNGQEVYSFLRSRNIKHVLFVGHATNINVLRKHAGSLMQVSTWGFEVTLLRDLTEPMVNPYRPPFHSEAETMTHAVNYIERFLGHSATVFDILSYDPDAQAIVKDDTKSPRTRTTSQVPASPPAAQATKSDEMGLHDYASPYQQVLRWDRHIPIRNAVED